jgi:hypothetical protein
LVVTKTKDLYTTLFIESIMSDIGDLVEKASRKVAKAVTYIGAGAVFASYFIGCSNYEPPKTIVPQKPAMSAPTGLTYMDYVKGNGGKSGKPELGPNEILYGNKIPNAGIMGHHRNVYGGGPNRSTTSSKYPSDNPAEVHARQIRR